MKLELLVKEKSLKFTVFQVTTSVLFLIAFMIILFSDELKQSLSSDIYLALRLLAAIGVIAFFPLNLLNHFPRFWTKVIGSIEFKNDSLLLKSYCDDQTHSYNYAQIQKIIIEKQEQPAGISFKPLYKIILKTNDSEFSYFFLLKNKKIQNNFKSVLENLYYKKVNLREYAPYGTRTFLLKRKLNFREVQKIKNEYKISW